MEIPTTYIYIHTLLPGQGVGGGAREQGTGNREQGQRDRGQGNKEGREGLREERALQ